MRDEHRSAWSQGDCRSATCQQRGGAKEKNWKIIVQRSILEELLLGACRNCNGTLATLAVCRFCCSEYKCFTGANAACA